MKRQWDEDELAEQWTLTPEELALHASQARAAHCWLADAGALRGPAGRATVAAHRRLPPAIRRAGRRRSHARPSRPTLGLTPDALHRPGQDPRSTRRHGRGRQRPPHRCLVRRHPVRHDTLFPLRGAPIICPGEVSPSRIRHRCQGSCVELSRALASTTRLQNRTCRFGGIRLLGRAVLGMNTYLAPASG